MNRRWQKRCTQLILGGRPVPVLVAMVNEAPKSFILTFWLIEELFYICIHLNHITSCNPLLNTILIVMGHVITTCRNMMLFSRPVSYTKIPPVYIPTSITACTINRNYYYLKIFIILPVGPLENFNLVPELPKIHQVFHSIQKSKTILNGTLYVGTHCIWPYRTRLMNSIGSSIWNLSYSACSTGKPRLVNGELSSFVLTYFNAGTYNILSTFNFTIPKSTLTLCHSSNVLNTYIRYCQYRIGNFTNDCTLYTLENR